MNSIELSKIMRKDCVEMAYLSKGSHVACALSIVDILSVLYNDVLNFDLNNLESEDRDFFILSKGHAGSAVYSALARKGFFNPDILKTHYANGSILSGHVSHKTVPGVEVSTGSLGHGVSMAAGIAYGLKKDSKKNKVYVLVGDGECNEGSVWEMALFASHHNLNNLVVIVDSNKFQALGECANILKNDNLCQKFETFGFKTIEIDGHSHDQIKNAFSTESNEKPICIIANTIKGKGVSFMENDILWHYRNPSEEQYQMALKEIDGDNNA